MRALRAAALCAALLALGMGVASVGRGGVATDGSRELVIAVWGRAAVSSAPDRAVIKGAVQGSSASAQEARAQEEESFAQVRAALAPFAGIALVPGQYGVHPRYQYDPGRKEPGVAGYTASRQFEVRLEEVEVVGDVLARLHDAGAPSVHEVVFTVAQPEELQRQAIQAALGDAGGRAEAVAATLGARVAEVVDVSVWANDVVPAVFAAGGEAVNRSAPAPVKVDASVTVRYLLRYPAQ